MRKSPQHVQEPAPAEQEPGSGTQEDAQPVSDGTYTIRSAAGESYVLDIMGGSQDDGANLALYTLTGVNWQQSTLTYEGDGFYSIVTLHSGKPISATSSDCGFGVVQQPYTGDDSQPNGIIASRGYGSVEFAMPYFAEYLKNLE